MWTPYIGLGWMCGQDCKIMGGKRDGREMQLGYERGPMSPCTMFRDRWRHKQMAFQGVWMWYYLCTTLLQILGF